MLAPANKQRSSVSSLMEQWRSLGYRFAVAPSSDPVDLEFVVAATAIAGRDEPALLWAMFTWIAAYGDLVNTHRLLRALNTENGPVLGAMVDVVLSQGADAKLKYIRARCSSRRDPEILFHVMDETAATREYEKSQPLPIFLKWGFYCSSMTIKNDALEERSGVLIRNPNLAARAVFGANARAEVLGALLPLPRTCISQLSSIVGLSYQPVYAEVMSLIRNGMVEVERIGRTSIISLAPRARAFMAMLPV